MKYLLVTLLFISHTAMAYEKADAFVVKAHEHSYSVLSPSKFFKKSTVIINNKTLTRIYGKIESSKRDKVIHVSIDPAKVESIDVSLVKGEILYFVPQSPPFQKVALKLGQKSYEIPPKR